MLSGELISASTPARHSSNSFQAVDYSKHGVEVDLQKNPLPRTLLPVKPDWQSNDPNPPETDYYKSNRALGDIWRGIEFLPSILDSSGISTRTSPLNPISSILKTRIQQYIDPDTCIQCHSEIILRAFHRYRDELQYICNMHVLTAVGNTPNSLRESEVVLGVILTGSSDKEWKKDRTWRMKTHTRMLIREVKVALKLITEGVEPKETLELAWCAWETSVQRGSEFAANSFGLIALDCLFQALEKLTLI
jgi:RNA-dependent RNA polymerase